MALIGKKWKIESDDLNVTLSRYHLATNELTGERYDAWDAVGFYATLENALHALVEFGVRETQYQDLTVVNKRITQLQTDIKRHFSTHEPQAPEGIKIKSNGKIPPADKTPPKNAIRIKRK